MLARFANFAIAIAGKRLVGGLKAGRYPLWGAVYFRWWLANKFSELPDVFLLAGTPWMPLYLRALGARVGRDVMIDMITLAAPELLTVEDGVSLGTFVNIENARVEAGELILGPVRLKKRFRRGFPSAVLENDTALGERARLSGQSALAAGRKIPDGEIWEGAPARRYQSNRLKPLPPRPQVTFVRALGAGRALFAVTAIAVSMLFFLPTFPAFMLIDWIDAQQPGGCILIPELQCAHGVRFLLSCSPFPPAHYCSSPSTMLVTRLGCAGCCHARPPVLFR